MTSQERHEARYQRRRAKRLEKRAKIASQYNDFIQVFGAAAIARSYPRVRSTSAWKSNTQLFGAHLFSEVGIAAAKLEDGTWEPGIPNCFTIKERGKERNIKSVPMVDKCIQNSFMKNCLLPILSNSLIDNNAASIPGKGTDYAIRKLNKDLSRHYRKYGLSGHIMTYDFSNYFASIPHNLLAQHVAEYVQNDRVMNVYNTQLRSEGDGEVGISLGSPIAQISAVFYPNEIDHYFTNTLGLEGYGRFMDDGYVLVPPRMNPHEIQQKFFELCVKLRLQPNHKKCQIIKFGQPFQFLKIRYQVLQSGKLVRRINRKSITRERAHIRGAYRLVRDGKMTYEQAQLNLYSWLCSRKRAMSFHICKNMISYFTQVFHQAFAIPQNKPRYGKRQQWRKVKYAWRVENAYY